MQNINPKLILNKVLNKNSDDYDRQILDNYNEKYNGHQEFNSNMINNSVKFVNEIDDYNNKLYQKNLTESENRNNIREKSREFTDNLCETFNNNIITIKLNNNYIYKTVVVVLLIIILIYLYKIYSKVSLDKKIHYNYLGF